MTERRGQEDQDMAGGERPRRRGSWEGGRSAVQGDSQTHLLQRPEDVERRLVALPTRPRGQDTGSVPLTRLPSCRQRPSPRRPASDAHTQGLGARPADPVPPAEPSPVLRPPLSVPNLRNPFPFPQASRPLFPPTA